MPQFYQIVFTIFVYLFPLLIVRPFFHYTVSFWRKLGSKSWYVWGFLWILIAVLMYPQEYLFTSSLFPAGNDLLLAAAPFLVAWLVLFLWSVSTLGLKTMLVLPELELKRKVTLVTTGPFSIVRHPIYLAELCLIIGTFLITNSLAMAILLILWIATIYPLTVFEEIELVDRFGKKYEAYQKKVSRVIPFLP